jgi:tetratricopeptide (TPR) repeat protein
MVKQPCYNRAKPRQEANSLRALQSIIACPMLSVLLAGGLRAEGGANARAAAMHVTRAAAFNKQLEVRKAIDEYTQAIALQPNDAALYFGRGKLDLQYVVYDQALADYTKAIQLAPKIAGYYRARARLYMKLGERKKALDDSDQAVILQPEDAGGRYDRGGLLERAGQYDKATKDLAVAVSSAPDQPPYRQLLGEVLNKQKRYKEAIDAFTGCIKIAPDLPGAYDGRAHAYEALKEQSLAKQDRAKARQLEKEY